MGSGNRSHLLGGALLGCVAALPAYAVTDSTTGTFTTANQSEWSGGPATVFNYTSPLLGPSYTLLAFVIVITGGLGSLPGALLGGILIGLTEALAGLVFPASLKSMFAFAILVVVLLFRPQGILGRRLA